MRMPIVGRRLLLAMATVAIGAGLTISVLAADPGSKEDPLATVSYVQHRGMFTLQEYSAGASIRLGPGAEIVVAQPEAGQLVVDELDPLRDDMLDLSAGERLSVKALLPAHHYVNASNHDVFIRPMGDCTLLLRGEWK